MLPIVKNAIKWAFSVNSDIETVVLDFFRSGQVSRFKRSNFIDQWDVCEFFLSGYIQIPANWFVSTTVYVPVSTTVYAPWRHWPYV